MLGILDQEQIETLLGSQALGRIGGYLDGRVYLVPVSYAYDGTSVYCHSTDGMKLRMMRQHPQVCFEVERIENMANWQSVIAWGVYEELHGEEAKEGMRFLVGRLLPYITSETAAPTHGVGLTNGPGHHAIVYRIRLHEKTGRFEKRI